MCGSVDVNRVRVGFGPSVAGAARAAASSRRDDRSRRSGGMVSATLGRGPWSFRSLPQMRRILQHPLTWCVALAGAALLPPGAADRAGGQQPVPLKPFSQGIPGTKVKFDMVPVPGGTFLMGSPETEKGRSPDEGPQHPV